MKMQLLGQKCRSCDDDFEDPCWYRSEISRILNNLFLKVKKNIYQELKNRGQNNLQLGGKMKGPHRSDLCQACERGFCTES